MALTEDQKKALDLTVDSLKMYITLATFAIAGLLGIYTSQKNNGSLLLFYLSVGLLFGCAIVSTVLINSFIRPTHGGNDSILDGWARLFNGVAIFLFFGGIIVGGFYIVDNSKMETKLEKGKISIMKDKIEIDGKAESAMQVEMDSTTGIRTIHISPSNK